MAWSGDFVFGDTWAAYRGPVSKNAPHAHACLQLAVGHDCQVAVEFDNGVCRSGPAWIIPPLSSHSIEADGVVGLLYVESESPLAGAILGSRAAADIAPAPTSLIAAVDLDLEPQGWVRQLSRAISADLLPIDERVSRLLAQFRDEPREGAISHAALDVGLSDSRLRALVRRQLGVPLSTWLLWRKLERAGRELAGGASLSTAAAAGGFADQAHFTRTMKRMFGITPMAAGEALR